MVTGLNPSEKPWEIKIHKVMNAKGWSVFEETINGFGRIKCLTPYTRQHTKMIILIDILLFDAKTVNRTCISK